MGQLIKGYNAIINGLFSSYLIKKTTIYGHFKYFTLLRAHSVFGTGVKNKMLHFKLRDHRSAV